LAARHFKTIHSGAAVVADHRRDAINLAMAELREPAEQISRALGLPASYLQTYLDSGMPATLPTAIRRRLAVYLGIPEQSLR